MTGHNPPKSPSVNNLISFWSDLEAPAPASRPGLAPIRPIGPPTALSAAKLPTTNTPRSVGSASSPALLSPRPPTTSTRFDGSGSTRPPPGSSSTSSILTRAPASSQTPTSALSSRASAPLFPLRSVAPPQSRVFGTHRHALDTINVRPLNFPPAQPPRHMGPRGPRASHHVRPHPITTNSNVVATSQEPPTSQRTSSNTPISTSKQNEGILKLAVIPPVQTKEDTLKHHQHLARSHPLVSPPEPLGRPIDALLPLVKPTSESSISPTGTELDGIPAVAASNSGVKSVQQQAPHDKRRSNPPISRSANDGAERATPPKKAPRPTSEPISRQPQHPSNQRRTRTSVGGEEGTITKVQGGDGRGSEIMYAVVKGLPAKPAIPKLIGATGSGTVIIPKSRQERQGGNNRSGVSAGNASEDMSSVSLISMNVDRRVARATRADSQATLVHSIVESNNSTNQSKRESAQSFTSLPSITNESILEDTGTFDDRDSKEDTSLLAKLQEGDLKSTNAYPTIKIDQVKANRTTFDSQKPLPSLSSRLQVQQKYDGGTPMGTKRSESSPELSTLDSSDALFQPTAPLITYPALDAYLSSLKPAQFSHIPTSDSALKLADNQDPSKTKSPVAKPKKAPAPDPREGMFPPLGLVPVGVSLDELKVNVTKPPGFFDQELQNVILSSAVDGIMSGEASNIGISWMRLEIIRDFLQFVGLYLSVSGNTFVNQKWLYATVNIIPAVLSLDFPRALGYGMVFLILFSLICFISLYTFKIMTRTDPNDDIEGLEVSSWSLRSKKQRIETISIVFLLTTLYLPLAKLSFDALVWSDTMWPIPNPYTNVDFPDLEPLGPSGIYRAPSDFCYVTSMKIQDLNFAYVIIPLAIFTLCANTFYFPLAIRRLVVLNLPRIDKYTEQGERRLDPDEEYKRLTNADNCPYNFLYNGYRREFGTYKVVVMFNKLLAVIIVVLFSKDNCLFRGYERRTIEATRAGLQIIFTGSLIYRHYRTQPFLYASQNLSEYWSRACTVATSVIGLFIVLNVGPVSVNTLGVMLVATYVLMCIIVIWFVIRQTQKFQVMLKQIQQRLDFSLEIYNPKLNYFKHIKRRIWQETWTTTLLVEDSFKMPAGKVVAYSQSPHRPPYLLNFTGTVAERHVENLRIVRQIGLRSYSQACQFLTPAIVRKRGLILKEFVGPDMYYAPEFMASNIKTYFGKAYVVPFPFSVVFVYDESSVVVTLVKEHDLDRYIQQNQDPEIQRRRDMRYQLRALDGKFVVRPFIETRGVQKGRESNGTLEMSLVNAPVSYKRGLFTIHRKKMSNWQGHNMNPGFSVTITYSDGEVQDPEGSSQLLHETTIGHDVIGITRDFQMTPALARLLRDNHALVSRGVKKVKKVMEAYQAHYRSEAHRKDETLSYDFFINVYDNPTLKHKDLEPLLLATEENSKIRRPSPQVTSAINFLYERMAAVNRTRCHQWWYLFWDDLYRKNREEIRQLTPKEFSPAYPGSICYQPMSRSDLERFLEKQGCWQKNGRAGFMHVGVLNKMYTFLNELVFEKMTKDQRQKQLELTTVERQRLENLFLVTKAKIHGNGTYKRMPLLDEYEEVEIETGLSRKPSSTSFRHKKSKKGWFESITPGWTRKHPTLPHLENYSPGYIIPQTWHQKASQFAALLIGGRPQDMIGESDEEDDLEDSDELAKKRRKTSVSSIETISMSERITGSHGLKKVTATKSIRSSRDSNDMTTEQQNPLLQQTSEEPDYKQRRPPAKKASGRQESWTSISTAGDLTITERARREELLPLSVRQSLEQSDIPAHKRVGQIRQGAEVVQRGGNGFNFVDEDSGVASDSMSITSMSSEDYW
ncbi:hypothetical protein BGX26_012794 [Mortierella sp. AD094]|nr:hypothetical protein BGX26_012794 [Mortierella sp. AD094]